jgi:ribosomal protein L27
LEWPFSFQGLNLSPLHFRQGIGILSYFLKGAEMQSQPALHNPPDSTTALSSGSAHPVADRIVHLVSARENIPVRHLLHRTRGSRAAADARHLAMYLIHVCAGHNLTEVGEIFKRDRTTIRHACARVEDARDDTAFDDKVAWFEAYVETFHKDTILDSGNGQ